MQRRDFLASTAGLAAAVVMGGVPALAGGEMEVVVTCPVMARLQRLAANVSSIWRERLPNGKWKVHGLGKNERGDLERIVVSDQFDEDFSLMACQKWSAWRSELTGEEIVSIDWSDVPMSLGKMYRGQVEHWLPKRFMPAYIA